MVYLPSLACADLLNLEAEGKVLIEAGHKVFHIDLMDGHYVPNLCLNLDLVKALKNRFDCEIDVHLMVDDPLEYVGLCADAGADYVSFHLDRARYPYRLMKLIKSQGMKAGIVLNPRDPVEALGALSQEMDYCLVMSIEPGFAGQKFMDLAYDKIRRLEKLKRNGTNPFLIAVDGGIDVETGKKCMELGADMLVMGVFSFFDRSLPLSQACSHYVYQVEGVKG